MNRDPNDNPEPKKETAHTGKLKPAQLKSTSSPLSSQPQQQKRILVIDDNPDIVFTLPVGLESDPTMQVFGYDNPVTALVEFEMSAAREVHPLKSIGCFIKKPAEQLLRRIKAELDTSRVLH